MFNATGLAAIKQAEELRRKNEERRAIEMRDHFLNLWEGPRKLKYFVWIVALSLLLVLRSCLTHVPEPTMPEYNYEHYPTIEEVRR